jgi:hypothetical protein
MISRRQVFAIHLAERPARMAKAGGRIARSSAAAVRRIVRELASRVTSRTVGPQLPHQATTFRSDRPSSSVITALAPRAAQRPGLEPRAQQARSARRPPDPRADVSGRHVLLRSTAWESNADGRAACLTDCCRHNQIKAGKLR